MKNVIERNFISFGVIQSSSKFKTVILYYIYILLTCVKYFHFQILTNQ